MSDGYCSPSCLCLHCRSLDWQNCGKEGDDPVDTRKGGS